jgi:GxxExxY protein
MPDEARWNEMTAMIIGAAMEVHRAVGPGLLENAYQACLVQELADRGLHLEVQKALPIIYKNVYVSHGYRIDILVEHQIIVEVKAVDRLLPVHVAQVLAYLKLTGCPIGLVLNFNTVRLADGIKRVINTTPVVPDEPALTRNPGTRP